MEKTKIKIHSIDLLKFLFSWVIVVFHFYGDTLKHFMGGLYAVEFFLIAASVLFFQKFERQEKSRGGVISSTQYFAKRFWRFFPWVITAYISQWMICRVLIPSVTSMEQGMDLFVEDLDELALIAMGGSVNGFLFHRNTWTISAMLITEFIIWWLLSNCKKVFSELIAPLSIIVGLGIQAHVNAPYVESWIGFTTTSLLRTWIVYCAGWECFTLTKKLKGIKLKGDGVILFSALELMGYACVLWIMLNKNSLAYQWAITFLFAILVAFSMSGQTVLEKVLSKKEPVCRMCSFLGSISLSVYLMQEQIMRYMVYRWQDPFERYTHKAILLTGICTLSLAQWMVVPLLIKHVKRVKEGIKHHILEI